MKTLGVVFDPTKTSPFAASAGKIYHYLYNGSGNPAVNDFAVVSTSKAAWPQVVKIVSVQDGIDDKATRHIVGLVDLEAWVAREQRVRRRAMLHEKLLAMEKREATAFRFTALAARNPEAKQLLDELNALEKED